MANQCEFIGELQGHNNQKSCRDLFNCCDCGGNNCGCRECFSCNACECCATDDADDDLLDDFDALPEDIKAIMERLSDLDSLAYSEVKEAEIAANAIGYEFDWGLDAVPHNLRKIKGEGNE